MIVLAGSHGEGGRVLVSQMEFLTFDAACSLLCSILLACCSCSNSLLLACRSCPRKH